MKAFAYSFKWILLLAAIWLLFTAGAWSSWIIGIAFIALAILLQPEAQKPQPADHRLFNIVGLFHFIYFFMVGSLRGGVDVSRRVLSRKPHVDPIFYDYNMRLQLPYAQQLFISSISLLPGTLCAQHNNEQVRIHTLDQHMQTEQDLHRLEDLVGKIFGENYAD